MFLLETYVNNVVGSVEETVRMFAAGGPSRPRTADGPDELLETPDIDRHGPGLEPGVRHARRQDQDRACQRCKRSGEDKREKHADVGDEDALESHTFRGVGEIELPAPGLGSLNYDLYLRRLAKKHPNIPIIIEHLDESDVPRAKRFLDGKLRANGV